MPGGVCRKCGCSHYTSNQVGQFARAIGKMMTGNRDICIRSCDICGHHYNWHYY